MSERKTYMGRPNFPSDDRAAGDLGREHRLNVKTFSAVVLGDMPAAASSVRATVNVQPSVGWATEVHFDRNIDLGLDAKHGDEWWRTGDAPKDAPRALPRRPAAARKAAAAPPERAPPREAQEAVTVEPTGRVARKFAPGEISVGLHDGREWDFGLQPSAKRYKEKFG